MSTRSCRAFSTSVSGDKFDGDKVEAYPPGTVVVLPGNTSHFHWAKSGEYITQVTAIAPLGIDYVDRGDDPRQLNRDNLTNLPLGVRLLPTSDNGTKRTSHMNSAMSANDPKQTSRDNDAALATGFSEDHWTLNASKLKENAAKIVLTS